MNPTFWWQRVRHALTGTRLTPARARVDVITDGLQAQDQANLRGQLRQFVREVSPRLTPPLQQPIAQIEAQLLALLPLLAAQANSSERFTVERTICDYLPNIVRRYLNVPPTVRLRVHPRLGTTPEAAVKEQLGLLLSTLESIAEHATQGNAEGLRADGRLLREQFGQKQRQNAP